MRRSKFSTAVAPEAAAGKRECRRTMLTTKYAERDPKDAGVVKRVWKDERGDEQQRQRAVRGEAIRTSCAANRLRPICTSSS